MVFSLFAASAAHGSPFRVTSPSLSPARLDALLAQLDGSEARRQRAAYKELLSASAEDAPLLHQRLHRRTAVAPAEYRGVLSAIGAHLPDRHGRFGPAPAKRVDWLEALMHRRFDKRLARAHREARASVALMRALAHTRRPEAATSLLRFAYRHEGVFRDECGRLIRAMRDYAIPSLVRARALRDPLAFKMVRYATYQLDRLNRSRPELALKQSDPRLVVEILHAYGEVRQTSAVNAVLARTDDRAEPVRRAARWAMLRFVTGRPPDAVQRHLRLPGGRITEEEVDAYLTYQQLARQQLATRLATLLAEAEGTGGATAETRRKRLLAEEDGRSLAAQLFAFYDRIRAEAQRERFQRARRLAQRGELDRALAEFDRLLATDPHHPQTHVMAAEFRKKAIILLQRGSYERAVLLLSKALSLAATEHPDSPRRKETLRRIRALRATAEALRDERRGLSPAWRLEEALALAPNLALVRDTHQRIIGKRRLRTALAGGTGGAVILALLYLALRRRRAASAAAPARNAAPRHPRRRT